MIKKYTIIVAIYLLKAQESEKMKKYSIALLASIFCFQQTQSYGPSIIYITPEPVHYHSPAESLAGILFAGSLIAGVTGLIDLCDNSERSEAETTSNGIIKLTGACALAALGALLLKSA